MTIDVKYTPFPVEIQGKVKGFSTKTGTGYQVIIDSTRYPIEQRFILGHELAHIFMGHHGADLDIDTAEQEADRNAWKYYRLYRDNRLEGTIEKWSLQQQS